MVHPPTYLAIVLLRYTSHSCCDLLRARARIDPPPLLNLSWKRRRLPGKDINMSRPVEWVGGWVGGWVVGWMEEKVVGMVCEPYGKEEETKAVRMSYWELGA